MVARWLQPPVLKGIGATVLRTKVDPQARLWEEILCAEVTDSISWRRFCRIGPYDKVPDASTLMKITRRCGDDVVAQLNEALLKKANAEKLVKLDKVRADTTVVPGNVAYPTDSGLLAKG